MHFNVRHFPHLSLGGGLRCSITRIRFLFDFGVLLLLSRILVHRRWCRSAVETAPLLP